MKKLLKRIPKMDTLRILIAIFLVVGVLLPIIVMLFQIEKNDIKSIFTDSSFYEQLWNSTYSTLISTSISVLISLVCAYLLNRSTMRHKNIFIVLLTLPMLIPSISHAYGLINLFGENGFLDKLFGIKAEIYGLSGLIFGSVMYSFPISFLLIYDALKYEDKSVYDACATLGISKFRSFFSITLPYLKTAIISAFFAVFTMIFTDYGVPLAIAGSKFPTISWNIYIEVISLNNFSKGAVMGMVLLLPAVIAFVYDLLNKENQSSEKAKNRLKVGRLFNIFTYVILILVSFIIIIPQVSFILTSFVKSFPNDLRFTSEHLDEVIGKHMMDYFQNSLIISLLTGIFGTIFAYLTAYLSTRIGGKIGKILHFIAITSLAIPGIVLGIGFIFIYKQTFIYQTIIILIFVNIIHFFSSPYLLAKNALEKLNNNYESVGSTIGVSRLRILVNVLIPNSFSTIFEMFSYFFVNSMITISAVSLLYSYGNQPLSIMIPQLTGQLNIEQAGIVSLLILVTNIVVKCIVSVAKKLAKKIEKSHS